MFKFIGKLVSKVQDASVKAQIVVKEKVEKLERGQGLLEYALIIALVALVVILAVTTLGGKINSVFSQINGELNNVVGNAS